MTRFAASTEVLACKKIRNELYTGHFHVIMSCNLHTNSSKYLDISEF